MMKSYRKSRRQHIWLLVQRTCLYPFRVMWKCFGCVCSELFCSFKMNVMCLSIFAVSIGVFFTTLLFTSFFLYYVYTQSTNYREYHFDQITSSFTSSLIEVERLVDHYQPLAKVDPDLFYFNDEYIFSLIEVLENSVESYPTSVLNLNLVSALTKQYRSIEIITNDEKEEIENFKLVGHMEPDFPEYLNVTYLDRDVESGEWVLNPNDPNNFWMYFPPEYLPDAEIAFGCTMIKPTWFGLYFDEVTEQLGLGYCQAIYDKPITYTNSTCVTIICTNILTNVLNNNLRVLSEDVEEQVDFVVDLKTEKAFACGKYEDIYHSVTDSETNHPVPEIHHIMNEIFDAEEKRSEDQIMSKSELLQSIETNENLNVGEGIFSPEYIHYRRIGRKNLDLLFVSKFSRSQFYYLIDICLIISIISIFFFVCFIGCSCFTIHSCLFWPLQKVLGNLHPLSDMRLEDVSFTCFTCFTEVRRAQRDMKRCHANLHEYKSFLPAFLHKNEEEEEEEEEDVNHPKSLKVSESGSGDGVQSEGSSSSSSSEGSQEGSYFSNFSKYRGGGSDNNGKNKMKIDITNSKKFGRQLTIFSGVVLILKFIHVDYLLTKLWGTEDLFLAYEIFFEFIMKTPKRFGGEVFDLNVSGVEILFKSQVKACRFAEECRKFSRRASGKFEYIGSFVIFMYWSENLKSGIVGSQSFKKKVFYDTNLELARKKVNEEVLKKKNTEGAEDSRTRVLVDQSVLSKSQICFRIFFFKPQEIIEFEVSDSRRSRKVEDDETDEEVEEMMSEEIERRILFEMLESKEKTSEEEWMYGYQEDQKGESYEILTKSFLRYLEDEYEIADELCVKYLSMMSDDPVGMKMLEKIRKEKCEDEEKKNREEEEEEEEEEGEDGVRMRFLEEEEEEEGESDDEKKKGEETFGDYVAEVKDNVLIE